MQHFVYILYSKSINRYYIGSSEDPEKRLIKHLANHSGFTGKAKDWIICYKESFQNRLEALKREREIKKWKSRKMIEDLIDKSV